MLFDQAGDKITGTGIAIFIGKPVDVQYRTIKRPIPDSSRLTAFSDNANYQ